MAFVHLIWTMFVYGFGCLFFINYGTPTGSFPERFVKIPLDLAEIYSVLKKLDWRDGEGKGRGNTYFFGLVKLFPLNIFSFSRDMIKNDSCYLQNQVLDNIFVYITYYFKWKILQTTFQ